MLSAISLFTGVGGLDFGFEAAGFRTAAAVEIDPHCIATLKRNREWSLICQPIEEISSAEILRSAGLGRAEADILIGGPPCQPFSKSGFWATGESKRLEDPRANTLKQYFRVLREIKPRTFLLENVEGLGFRGKDEAMAFIRAELVAINRSTRSNYQMSLAVINAADYGVPQLRRRVFIVGSRDGRVFQFPERTHSPTPAVDGRLPYRTAWDALHNVETVRGPELELKGKWAALLPSIPEGQNYLWHTDRGEGEPLFGWRRRYWSFLLKLSKSEPAWTLQAQPGPATGPFHWANRKLSAHEMARLMTFPQGVELDGVLTVAQREIGNAVPSLLAEILARAIAQQLLDRRPFHGPPRFEVPEASIPAPPPEPVARVPRKYLSLRGNHDAHPGTGKGYRALSRQLVAAD